VIRCLESRDIFIILTLRWIHPVLPALPSALSRDGCPLIASVIAVTTIIVLHHLILRRTFSRFMPFCWCEDKKRSSPFRATSTFDRIDDNSTCLANSVCSVPDKDRPFERQLTNSKKNPPYIKNVREKRVAEERPSWFDHIYWKSPKTLFEDILTMGNCLVGGPGTAMIIDRPDGDEKDFHARYIEDRILGQGEFGVVRLVLDMREKDESRNTMACKVLRKGVVFKGRS
jgi:hypothetical protein